MTFFSRRALTTAAAIAGAALLTACSGSPEGRSAFEQEGDRAKGSADAPDPSDYPDDSAARTSDKYDYDPRIRPEVDGRDH